MKTVVGFITVLAFLFGMTACGNTKPDQDPKNEEKIQSDAESSSVDPMEERDGTV